MPYCEICEENGKKRKAVYECDNCGLKVCKKCDADNYGECPDCEPPRFREIKKESKRNK